MNNNDEILRVIAEDVRESKEDVREVKLAVMGDSKIGLNGLVKDMDGMKKWRTSIDLRVASISGGVAVFILLSDVIINKIFK